MKKLLLAVFSLLFIFTLVGCDKNDFEDLESSLSDDIYVSFEAYGDDVLRITENTGEEEFVNETTSMGWLASEGMRIGDILTEWQVVSIEACINDELEGWLAYKIINETDENDFVTSTAQRISDTIYTTEEILDSETPSYDITYFAKCKSQPIEYYNIQ